jgi:hypothetical protein
VSTPITWDEIDDVDPRQFTIATVPARFAELGDLHQGIDDSAYPLDTLLEWAERDGLDSRPRAPARAGQGEPADQFVHRAPAEQGRAALAERVIGKGPLVPGLQAAAASKRANHSATAAPGGPGRIQRTSRLRFRSMTEISGCVAVITFCSFGPDTPGLFTGNVGGQPHNDELPTRSGWPSAGTERAVDQDNQARA